MQPWLPSSYKILDASLNCMAMGTKNFYIISSWLIHFYAVHEREPISHESTFTMYAPPANYIEPCFLFLLSMKGKKYRNIGLYAPDFSIWVKSWHFLNKIAYFIWKCLLLHCVLCPFMFHLNRTNLSTISSALSCVCKTRLFLQKCTDAIILYDLCIYENFACLSQHASTLVFW